MADKKDLFKSSLSKRKNIRKAAPDLKKSEEVTAKIHAQPVEKILPAPPESQKDEKEAVQRITLDVPISVYTAMKHRVFNRRITLKKYMVELAKKDLNL